jgi:predicted DsbA family dithiol-disulfide isomerase
VSSVRYLQLSLAEIIAHNPQKSNLHYEAARREYHQAQQSLRQLGVKQVP